MADVLGIGDLGLSVVILVLAFEGYRIAFLDADALELLGIAILVEQAVDIDAACLIDEVEVSIERVGDVLHRTRQAVGGVGIGLREELADGNLFGGSARLRIVVNGGSTLLDGEFLEFPGRSPFAGALVAIGDIDLILVEQGFGQAYGLGRIEVPRVGWTCFGLVVELGPGSLRNIAIIVGRCPHGVVGEVSSAVGVADDVLHVDDDTGAGLGVDGWRNEPSVGLGVGAVDVARCLGIGTAEAPVDTLHGDSLEVIEAGAGPWHFFGLTRIDRLVGSLFGDTGIDHQVLELPGADLLEVGDLIVECHVHIVAVLVFGRNLDVAASIERPVAVGRSLGLEVEFLPGGKCDVAIVILADEHLVVGCQFGGIHAVGIADGVVEVEHKALGGGGVERGADEPRLGVVVLLRSIAIGIDITCDLHVA